MDRMVEIHVIRDLVHLHPRNGRVVRGAVADDLEAGIVFQHLIMAVHAGGRPGQIGEPGFLHAVVAITAVERQLTGMNPVREGHGLHGLVAGTVEFGREIDRHARRNAGTSQRGDRAEHQRQTICPLGKNHFFRKTATVKICSNQRKKTRLCFSNYPRRVQEKFVKFFTWSNLFCKPS